MEVPMEIWTLVASFLADDELYRVRGINRALYQLAIENKYRKVSLDLVDREKMDLVR
jgi:hypothetical protein